MKAWGALALAGLAGLAAACSRAEPRREPPPPLTSHVRAAPVNTAQKSAPAPVEPVCGASATRALLSAKSIGNTSIVFKLTYDSGDKAVFKPRSRRGRDRYKGEVAAYRLSQALGITAVPQATVERMPLAALESAMAGQTASLELAKKEIVADADGKVSGALIPWINDLEFMKLEAEPLRSKWRAWLLDPAPVPEDSRALAGQIATMIVFDALTGNWDRWSGANVGSKPKSRELLFVDNDGAFMVPTPAPFERQRELLKGLKKYPRGLVGKLRELDAAQLRAALGDEAPGAQLLPAAAVDQLDARRRDVLAEADARIRELGEAKVFVFE